MYEISSSVHTGDTELHLLNAAVAQILGSVNVTWTNVRWIKTLSSFMTEPVERVRSK